MKKLIAIGEALVDFIPQICGAKLKEVPSFERHCGGAPTNVAATYAFFGGEAFSLTKLGNDAFGDYIVDEMTKRGIKTDYVMRTDEANTSLAFVSLDNNGERDFSFYRKPGSDMLISSDEIKKEWFLDCILHFCSVDLVECPTKYTHISAIEYTKQNGGLISFDPNLRFPLWESKEALQKTVRDFISYADIVKISEDEALFITGESNLEKAAKTLLSKGVKLVFVTMGSKGAIAVTGDVFVESKGVKAEKIVDTTGAGDIFIGSALYYMENKNININKITVENLRAITDFACKVSANSVGNKGAVIGKEIKCK